MRSKGELERLFHAASDEEAATIERVMVKAGMAAWCPECGCLVDEEPIYADSENRECYGCGWEWVREAATEAAEPEDRLNTNLQALAASILRVRS